MFLLTALVAVHRGGVPPRAFDSYSRSARVWKNNSDARPLSKAFRNTGDKGEWDADPDADAELMAMLCAYGVIRCDEV